LVAASHRDLIARDARFASSRDDIAYRYSQRGAVSYADLDAYSRGCERS